MTSDVWVFLGICVTAICSCVGVITTAKVSARQKLDTARAEAHAKRRERESRLSMEMMYANSELADVTAIAVSGGHVNGNVEAARNKARLAREEYERFLRDEAARQVAQ